MKIRKLSIDGFGLFDGKFDLDFSDEVALIVGDNETGKSTLLRAIGAILFGFRYENDRTMFAPNGTANPRRGSLEIESRGTLCRFNRDFASNHTRIERIGANGRVLFDGSAKPGGRTEEKESYDVLMRELIGIDDEDLFENSVFFKQNSLCPEMEGVARQIVSGTVSADFAVALDNLKEECESLTLELPWSKKRKPRRIELLESGLRDKKNMLTGIRSGWAGIEEASARLAATEAELKEVEQKIAEQKSWEKDLSSFSLAHEECKRVEKQMNECRRQIQEVETLTNTIKEYDRHLKEKYQRYESLSEQIETVIATVIQLRENAEELQERRKQVETDVPRFRLRNFRIPAVLLVLDLVLFALSLLAGLGGVFIVLLVLAGMAICAWPFIAAALSLATDKSIYRSKLMELNDQIGNLRRRTTETEERHSILKGRDPSDVLKELREFRDLVRQKEKKEEALKQHPSLEELQEQYDSVSNDYVIAKKSLEELISHRPSLVDVDHSSTVGNEIEKARTFITRLDAKQQELETEKKGLEIRIATTEAGQTVSEESLLEEIAEMEAELKRLKLSREAHLIAIKVLEEAVSEFRASHLIRIEGKTSDYLQKITGIPCVVRLDENLDPIGIEREGHLFRPEQLSQGTRDQLYFALRIASIEEISGDIHLPILLDDPFVNFDEKRLRAVLDVLSVISESHQIVLFTHERRFSDWRDPSCILERR